MFQPEFFQGNFGLFPPITPLNESQRGIIAAKLANMMQGTRTDLEPLANLPKVISQPEASKLLNVSSRTIRDAKSIMKEAPEKVQAIERGEKTIHEVKREIKKAEWI